MTDNWCLPKYPGKLDPETFTPQPKNPLIANFFVNIGYADTLGSGVRNLYKYTKIYSGKEPALVEGDIFRTIVPLVPSGDSVSDNGEMSDNEPMSDKTSDNVSDNGQMSDKNSRGALLPTCEKMEKPAPRKARRYSTARCKPPAACWPGLSPMASSLRRARIATGNTN